ncbi:MAG: hypothetical protein R3B47_14345 [Bacteroidia bacterium]
MLKDGALLKKQYFLLRQAVKDILTSKDDSKTMNVRVLSKVIADSYPAFNTLRVKIHGQPEASDIERVIAFKATHSGKLGADLNKNSTALVPT